MDDYRRVILKTYIVTGKTPFPMDMLRFEEAWPTGLNDAKLIEESLSVDAIFRRRDIKITGLKFTPARWDSFNWKAREVETSIREG